ncbi:SGNH/GDSL hydrolase family protein [Actinoplanes missouriensis]|uniref:SGNH/GDSL hydrolase family protein n=1 Tax=Actinoplanes missouriensis TaxID=1866 RepID=UPI0003160333|nr:SGNH/GDSL hydrolase family protein [Actinoplanes missouriensis]
MREPIRAGTWAAPVTAQPAEQVQTLADQTVRQVVHASIGGDQPQVRFSNEFGAQPVRIGAASLGLRSGTGASTDLVPGTGQPLTFAGRPDAVIPAGGTLISDSADLVVPPGGDLVISLYLPDRTQVGTVTPLAYQMNMVAPGNLTAADRISSGGDGGRPAIETIPTYLFLSGVSVRARRSTSSIVAFGDSITRGAKTAQNANHRWPDLLAARLRDGDIDRGVLNTGISRNRLLSGPIGRTGRAGSRAWAGESGLRRFERDVLAQPAVSHAIVLLGVNDLGLVTPPTIDELIVGHRELIKRGRAAGVEMIGGTLLPFGGYRGRLDSPETRAKRDAFNAWVRRSGEYDAVVDFDAAVRDPAAPDRMLAAYDSGDHLHPSDEGMAAMAAAVPLNLFA